MQVPIYAHVKEVVDPEGNLTAVEINYMKFLAFNGSYKVHKPEPVCLITTSTGKCCYVLCTFKPEKRMHMVGHPVLLMARPTKVCIGHCNAVFRSQRVPLCLQLFDWIYIGEVGARDGD